MQRARRSRISHCRSSGWMLVLVTIFLTSLAQLPAVAQEPQARAGSSSTKVDADDLRARIEVTKARTDLSESERDLVLEQLKAALARTESAEAARKASAEYTATLKAAPATIAALGSQSVEVEDPAEPEVAGDGDVLKTQLQLAALQAEAVSVRSSQRALEETLTAMATRPAEARIELGDLRGELDRVEPAIAANASPSLIEASRLRADAARDEISARIEKTEQELLTLPTRESIATARRDLGELTLARVDASVASLQLRVNAQREAEATRRERDAKAMQAQLDGQPEAIRQLAADTSSTRAAFSKISRNLDAVHAMQDMLRTQLQAIEDARRTVDQMVKLGPVGDVNGQLLRDIEKELPALAELKHRIAKRDAHIVETRVGRLKHQQRARRLEDAPAAAGRALDVAGLSGQPGLLATATQLATELRTALIDLQALEGQSAEAMAQASALDSELLQRTVQLRFVLDERLLWLPSAEPLNGAWLRDVGRGFAWVFSPSNWMSAGKALMQAVKSRPLSLAVLLVIAAALAFARKPLKRAMANLAKPIGHRGDRFGLTWAALGASVLLALPLPLLVGTFGVALLIPESLEAFPNALATGLIAAALVMFMLGIFQVTCRRDGLFTAHFEWDEKGTRRLGYALRMLALVMVPAALLRVIANAPDTAGMANALAGLDESVGRLGLMAGALALAMFMYRVFRPHDGALTGGLQREGHLWRTRHVWFWGLVAVPLFVGLMTAAGYYATASALQARLFTTGWVFLMVVIAYQIALRGIVVSGRRTAYEQAAARHAKQAAKAEAHASGEALPQHDDDEEIDVVNVSHQTRSLLRATSAVVLFFLLLGIWKGLVPALSVFNDIVLWSQVSTGAAGNVVSAFTLADLLTTLLVLVLTFVAARNLPGFLEIAVLQRFTIDTGTRYAISTIARYAILGIGLVITFSHIGADWSKLQWIVAALGVGLGFGLQEIVANFISGIIILFERPVRVGDLVTIGNTSGTVTRIKIRAITITDFDNFEVLVPNKSFITEPVQNWSLTSPITRLLIKIGVAYGSDVDATRQVMIDAVKSVPEVLETSSPSVLFVEFGDSALQFEIRAFVGRIDHRLQVQHALHMAVNNALNQAGIQIPFPQRDLHIRSTVVAAPAPEQEPPTEQAAEYR